MGLNDESPNTLTQKLFFSFGGHIRPFQLNLYIQYLCVAAE